MENMILKSINHIANVLGDAATAPKFHFQLYFVNTKCTSAPKVNQLNYQYRSIVTLVSILNIYIYYPYGDVI